MTDAEIDRVCEAVKDIGGATYLAVLMMGAQAKAANAEIEALRRRADLAEAAGMERAAVICESRIGNYDYSMDSQQAAWDAEAKGCANFIRAAITKEPK